MLDTDKKQKTILVTVFHSLVSKNILNTDALKILQDTGEYRIILLVPDIKKAFFEEYYANENVCVEGVDMQTFGKKGVEDFMHIMSRLLIDTHYLHYKRRELLYANKSVIIGWIQYILRQCVVVIFADKKIFRWLFRFMDGVFSKKDFFLSILDNHKPDLIFSTDLFEQMGNQLIREAKKRKIKNIGMVRSWDNCLSKGLLRVIPDVIIANNLVIKEELITIHDVAEKKIEVVGLPQFDSFLKKEPEDRVTFFNKNNLDPTKKLVMFAPGGSALSNTDGDICRILSEAKDSGMLPKNIQFFIRNHPQHPADLSGIEARNDFLIQTPGKVIDKTNQKETELTPEDQDFLRNILAHTDVLVWVATSLCLDALVYDVPQVVINFDGFANKDYYHSVKRYHDEDHMKKMFKFKPFRVANTAEDLVSCIKIYLEDRSIDRKERVTVKEQQLFMIDGRSGQRIASILERELK